MFNKLTALFDYWINCSFNLSIYCCLFCTLIKS